MLAVDWVRGFRKNNKNNNKSSVKTLTITKASKLKLLEILYERVVIGSSKMRETGIVQNRTGILIKNILINFTVDFIFN